MIAMTDTAVSDCVLNAIRGQGCERHAAARRAWQSGTGSSQIQAKSLLRQPRLTREDDGAAAVLLPDLTFEARDLVREVCFLSSAPAVRHHLHLPRALLATSSFHFSLIPT